MTRLALMSMLALVTTAASFAAARNVDSGRPASPLYGVPLPDGYRDWPVVSVAREAAPLDELRVIVGNPVAMRAFRNNVRPFPDGTVLVKRAWTHEASPDFAPASIPGTATTVQVMVKDATRYAASGGWGYGRFVDGRPVDEAQHHTCHACHAARVSDRDFVFTRHAP